MIPEGLLYSNEHEWARLEEGDAVVGITDYAQGQLGDITFVELPKVGAEVKQGGELAVLESVKAASDIYAPFSGIVAEVNTALEDAPEAINTDPYGAGWICRLRGVNEAERGALLDARGYGALIGDG